MISVISMLSSPNDESPANIEAAVSMGVCIRLMVDGANGLIKFPTNCRRSTGRTMTSSRRRSSALSGRRLKTFNHHMQNSLVSTTAR